MWTRRILYGSRKFDVEISTGPNTSYPFLARMAAVKSEKVLLYSTITKKSPNSENHGFLQSKLLGKETPRRIF